MKFVKLTNYRADDNAPIAVNLDLIVAIQPERSGCRLFSQCTEDPTIDVTETFVEITKLIKGDPKQ